MFLFHLSSLSDKLPEHNNRLAKYEMAQESIGTNIVHNSIIIPTSSLAVMTLSKILCKWKQDSVVSLFLYLNSVFKHKHKLIHNQAPV